MSRHIAETIWQQLHLAGAMLPMSWGTHALKALPEGTIDQDFDCQLGGLQIMVHGALFKGHVRILLNWDDTYIVRIGRSRKGVWNEHLRFNDLYADDLAGVIDTAVETAPKVVATRAVDHVSEDSPEYGHIDRDKLDRFIMDEDNPMTCPACGARTVLEHTYEDGEQLHLCENDSCNRLNFLGVEPRGYFLGVEPEEDERLIERVMTARSALRLKGSGVYFEPEEDERLIERVMTMGRPPENKVEHALRDAYFELWNAVENGIDNDKFFELRETFRGIQTLIRADQAPENKVEPEEDDKEMTTDIYAQQARRIKRQLAAYAANMDLEMTKDEAQHAVNVFRDIYPEIPALWARFNELKDIAGSRDEPEEAVNDYFYKNLS